MKNKMNVTASHWVLILALLFAAFACFLLVEPYMNSIVMAFILSLLMFPIHEWIENKLPNHKNIVALLSCIVLTFIIVMPLLLVFSAIMQQGSVFSQNLYQWVTGGGIQEVIAHPWVKTALKFINNYLPFDAINAQNIAQKAAEFATSLGSNLVATSAKILGDATNFLMNFFLDAVCFILPITRSRQNHRCDPSYFALLSQPRRSSVE